MSLVSIHLEKKTSKWFQSYEVNATNLNWNSFIVDLLTQLGPRKYDNPMGQLTKLGQISYMREYQD